MGKDQAPASGPADVFWYRRVSTEDQAEEGLSLPAQLEQLMAYTAQHADWLPAGDEWDDETGKKVAREGYQRLLAQVRAARKKGRRVVVLTKKIDRFGRRLSEMARAFEEFEALGAEWWSLKEGGRVNFVNMGIHGTMSEQGSRDIGSNVRDVIESLHRKGWWYPGRVAWGYRATPATAEQRAAGAPKLVLTVDEAARAKVEDVFRLAAKGTSLHAIARFVAGLSDAERGGRVLSYPRIRLALRSRVYIGETPDGHLGQWPAIIDRATWDAVQARLSGEGRTLPKQATQRFLLTGMLWCPKCGARMAGSSSGGGRQARYKCLAPLSGATFGGACTYTCAAAAAESDVDRQVAPWFAAGMERFAEMAAQMWGDEPRDPSPAEAHRREVARLRAHLEKIERTIGKNNRAKLLGELDELEYRATYRDLRADHEATSADLARVEAETPEDDTERLPLSVVVERMAGWREVWAHGKLADKREMLAELVLKVEPVRKEGQRGAVAAKITPTATGELLAALIAQRAAE